MRPTCEGQARYPDRVRFTLGRARLGEALWLSYQISFRSPRKRLTWIASAALFLATLLLAGVIDRLPDHTSYPLPPGTAIFSWAKGYLVLVITPHLVLNLTAAQVAKATLLALAYGANVTLAAVQKQGACFRSFALSSIGIFFGPLGLSFCCGPIVGLVGALGLAPLTNKLWGASMVLLIIALLFLAIRVRAQEFTSLEQMRPAACNSGKT